MINDIKYLNMYIFSFYAMQVCKRRKSRESTSHGTNVNICTVFRPQSIEFYIVLNSLAFFKTRACLYSINGMNPTYSLPPPLLF